MSIPDDAELVLMRANEKGVFSFEFLTDENMLPDEAEYDNYLEVDGVTYPVWAMPDAPVVGRSFALSLWAEHLFDDEDQAYRDAMEAQQGELADHANDEPEPLSGGDDH